MPNLFPSDLIVFSYLQQQIHRGIQQWQGQNHDSLSSIAPGQISLSFCDRNSQFYYQSAVTFQLTAVSAQSPVTIAPTLAELLAQSAVAEQFQIQLQPSGKLNFYPCDRFLHDWLNTLPFHPYFTPTATAPDAQPCPNPFPFQYLIARCQQLLILAEETHLTPKPEPDKQDRFGIEWQWHQMQEGVMIDTQSQGALSTHNLIKTILQIVDAPSAHQKVIWSKLGRSLGEAFLDFHQNCPIWGNRVKKDVKLAQGRLKLIALTQFILKWLLLQKLNSQPLPHSQF